MTGFNELSVSTSEDKFTLGIYYYIYCTIISVFNINRKFILIKNCFIKFSVYLFTSEYST